MSQANMEVINKALQMESLKGINARKLFGKNLKIIDLAVKPLKGKLAADVYAVPLEQSESGEIVKFTVTI